MVTFLSLFFLFGLLIGSFLNVVLARLRTEETILGRSYCRSCRKCIAWYDNIPLISFFVLRGKCRHCKEKISPKYVFVEIGTGVLFALVGWKFFDPQSFISWIETLFYGIVFSLAFVIALYDSKYFEIPMRLMWAMILVIILFFLFFDSMMFSSVSSLWDLRLYSGLVAGIVAFEFFWLLSFISGERWMGYGDAYVAFALGLLLGTETFTAIVLAFVCGSIFGISQMLLGKKHFSSQIPFAPFLFFGMVVFLFFSDIFCSLSWLVVCF
ncbi:MAG: prepilin peptidase [Candidatus Moranbacteria bacterium]|nr:prepilin peptidase [Candidatus Moranbacteria bacterium]